jgi:hypothetical protein
MKWYKNTILKIKKMHPFQGSCGWEVINQSFLLRVWVGECLLKRK